MKKFFIMLSMIVAIVAITSCNPKGYDFEKTVSNDIASVRADYPEAIFYESQVVLNAKLDSVEFDKNYIVSLSNIFQSSDTVIILTHYADKNVETTIIPNEFVMEDSPIDYPVVLTFKDALTKLSETNCVLPSSDKVVFRRPFGPNPNNNPQYIFGSNDDFLFVNANTGEVCTVYNYERIDNSDLLGSSITNLDHDIYVGSVSCIENDSHTGFDTWVGPTGWPWTDKVKWETALYEDKDFYYGRFIFHEYMFWWSWDYPYVVVKIPKCNIDGDLRNNEKLRNEVMWKITHDTERTYSYAPYLKNPIIRRINGHTVSFGDYACKYEKYYVISDTGYDW